MKRILGKAFILIALLNDTGSFAKSPGLLFNVTASGNTLNISTTIPHLYPNAGIKVLTSGNSLNGVGTECVDAGNGYCLFSVSDTQSKNISILGSAETLSAILCMDGKGPLSCQNYNIPMQRPSTAKYVYVVNGGGTGSNIVSVCALDPISGLIVSCQGAGGGGAINNIFPQGIAINNTATMAYLTSYTNYGVVYQCPITANGMFATCTAAPITTPPGYEAYGAMIALNPNSTIAYLPDSDNTLVLACPIVNGNISATCSDTGATTLDGLLVGITLNRGGTAAYIAHSYGAVGVTVCAVNGSHFSSCTNKTGGGNITFSSPAGVALNYSENILYVADFSNNVVYGCSTAANNSSTFSSCFIATSAVSRADGIAVNAKSTEAYITDGYNTTYVCPIRGDGTFAACTISTTTFKSPIGIALGY